jgi:1-acyl-sn-glycerol-3-phosphate acyltransferase
MVASDAGANETTRRKLWTDVPLIWRIMLFLNRGLVAFMGRLTVTGRVPDELRGKPLLLAANHIGVFDAFVLMAACRKIGVAPRFLLTGGLLDAPILGPALRASGHLRVDRGKDNIAEAFARSIESLKTATVPLLVYPEGRISHDIGLWPERGKTGTARMALASGTPVVPISQWGAHQAVHWGTEAVHGWADIKPLLGSALSSPLRRPHFRVHFGEPVELAEFTAQRPGDPVRAHAKIMRTITDGLWKLRADEPEMPRYHDPTRPTDTRSPWRWPTG